MPTLTTYDYGQTNYRDTLWSKQPRGTSPWERLSGVLANTPATMVWLEDDFQYNNTVATNGLWNVVKGTGAALTLAGPGGKNGGGWISIPTAAAAANDYQCLFSQAAQYVFAAGSPLAFESYTNLTEANTNNASWFTGFTSTTATGFLQNSGAPAASFSGVVFWKAQGGLTLSVMTSNGATQNSTVITSSVVSGQSYVLGAYIDPSNGTTGVVTWYAATIIAGAWTMLGTGTLNLTLASLAAMYYGVGVRCASASAETLMVDYVQTQAIRALL